MVMTKAVQSVPRTAVRMVAMTADWWAALSVVMKVVWMDEPTAVK